VIECGDPGVIPIDGGSEPKEEDSGSPRPQPGPIIQTPPPASISRLTWTGEIPPQKWTNFYTKVLTKFSAGGGVKLTLKLDVAPEGGVSAQKIEETKVALRDLGLADDVQAE
jgi:hypothetical protein